MKILSVDQIRKLDAFTIENEPIASIDLMERASMAFVEWFVDRYNTDEKIAVFCGTGNNGGDGLAISRLLLTRGYNVEVLIVGNTENGSEDFKINLKRLGINPIVISDKQPDLSEYSVIIDAIFGSGLSRPAEGIYAEVIDNINQSSAEVVAVDMPSGLFADQPSFFENIVKADFTITFQLPKLALLFPNWHQFVGDWQVVDIGLNKNFIAEAKCEYHYISLEMAKGMVRQSSKFDHKGSNGHALIIAGAYGTMGAAVLMAKATIKAGVGLLTVNVPKCGYDIIQVAVPEAMAITDGQAEYITEIQDFKGFSAVGIGPGIGQNRETVKVISEILNRAKEPLVLDADALNSIASHQELLEVIPKNSILTPHPKEFERLFGTWSNDFERLEKQRSMAKKYGIIIVLKGAHTSIALPDANVYFNSTGNPGMANGGSGDVLCGIITSLLAQGYVPNDAAIFGVYLHGLAGDIARELSHEKSMSATDLIEAIPEAYHYIDQ
jgi:ADP-dependent NAD(P)H-hydrate dehydratase / NAD(P)H-hydrate epimerase